MIRSVLTGVLGLDVALQGGVRVIKRIPDSDAESAMMLVRGGPGTGKSILATSVALGVARELSADVLYACIEVLPTEVQAQRVGFDDGAQRFFDLSRCSSRPAQDGPLVAVGLAPIETGADGPTNLGAALLRLATHARQRGFSPKVVVVDSLSDGYKLGASASREQIDGLCKIAVEEGWVLVLVEEVVDPAPSGWSFAVDTVVELAMNWSDSNPRHRRSLRVAKHRFHGCHPGPHRVLIERERIRVIPPIDAYREGASVLKLPTPTTGRTLSFPSPSGDTTEVFAIPDGEGHVRDFVCTGITDSSVLGDALWRVNEASQPLAVLSFSEASTEVLTNSGGVVQTLHQFVDGREWLEYCVWQLSHVSSASWIVVGPGARLSPYGSRATIGEAVSVLSTLLGARKLAVLLLSEHGGTELVHAAIIGSWWLVGPNANDKTSLDLKSGDATPTITIGPFTP